MKELINRLQPDCFEDIIALVALFRPGPLQSGMVDDFIDRKHGRAVVDYPHPDLEPILKKSNGVFCIASGSPVRTEHGEKSIENVNPGEYVLVEDGSYQRVLANWDRGVKETIRIELYGGNVVICTPDHKILTENGWKEAQSLDENDFIKTFNHNKLVMYAKVKNKTQNGEKIFMKWLFIKGVKEVK
jgi:DNA polymerase-3 subunit alpha